MSPRQRKITQIAANQDESANQPTKMFASKYDSLNRINNNFRRSELNEHGHHPDLPGHMSTQRSTDVLFAAEHKAGAVNMASASGASASGTVSAAQMGAANKPFHFN